MTIPGTRTKVITWSSVVTQADPNWRRDWLNPPENQRTGLRRSPRIIDNWQASGPYAPAPSVTFDSTHTRFDDTTKTWDAT